MTFTFKFFLDKTIDDPNGQGVRLPFYVAMPPQRRDLLIPDVDLKFLDSMTKAELQEALAKRALLFRKDLEGEIVKALGGTMGPPVPPKVCCPKCKKVFDPSLKKTPEPEGEPFGFEDDDDGP